MAARRAHGEGSIYFDESVGLFRGSVDLGRDANGKRRRKTVTGRTKTLVRARLRELQTEVAAGVVAQDVRYTITQLMADWLDDGLPGKSFTTVENYRWAANRHIVPGLGARRVRDLSPDDVGKFLNSRAAMGMSRSSLRRVHNVLAQALRFAERRGRVARNVANLVDTPDGPAKVNRALTIEQAQALLTALDKDPLRPVVVVGLMLGLRPGELLGLRWADVDVEAGTLVVSQALRLTREGYTFGETKTRTSRRALALPTPVVEAFKAQRTAQAAQRLAAGVAWTDLDLVFSSNVGTIIDPSNLRRAFARATKNAKLGHWHPHELRHSAVSILSASGVPIEDIADLVGHATTRVTEAVYRHRLTPTIKAGTGTMESLFGAG